MNDSFWNLPHDLYKNVQQNFNLKFNWFWNCTKTPRPWGFHISLHLFSPVISFAMKKVVWISHGTHSANRRGFMQILHYHKTKLLLWLDTLCSLNKLIVNRLNLQTVSSYITQFVAPLLVFEPLLGLLEDVIRFAEKCLAVFVDRLVDRGVRFVKFFRCVLRQFVQVI